MRKLICILALAAILICAAQAEESFGTKKNDLYYHVNLHCGGADGMVPISAEGAEEFKKYPCPICVPDDTQWANGVAAVARGNTIIVRMADSYLAEPELTGVFGFAVPETAPVSEAAAFLSEDLHGEAYNRILQEIESGSADTIIRTPAVLPKYVDDQSTITILNRRHIGNAWYYAVRPADSIGDTWNMYWRINGHTLQIQDDQLMLTFDQQTVESDYPLSVPQFSEPAAFTAQFDGRRIDVFAGAGQDVCANVAVITQFDADPDYMENNTLCIGDQVRIPVDGYMDGANGIFCCTLTDAEYAYLANGADVSIQAPSYMDNASFENSAYAAVRKGTGGMGIVDTNGAFVVQPEYKTITHASASNYPTTAPIPFFCTDYDGNLTVLDGGTLNVIAQYAVTHDYLRAEYLNPAAFEIYDGRGLRILSLSTGDMLMDIPYGADGNYIDGISYIDGSYRCMADGLPDRLVRQEDGSAWLITLTGEPLSATYSRITPLIWKDRQGVFLVEMWDSIAENSVESHYFERGKVLSTPNDKTNWRCGLMNQDGEIIMPLEYNSIEVTNDLNIVLGNADGQTIVSFDSAADNF